MVFAIGLFLDFLWMDIEMYRFYGNSKFIRKQTMVSVILSKVLKAIVCVVGTLGVK